MKKYSILILVAITILVAASQAAAMKSLDDQQMDFITAGSSATYHTKNNSSNELHAKIGLIDNSVKVNNSLHSLAIVDSHVDIKAFSSTVGSENAVTTGINVSGFIGRAPGSPRESSGSPDISGLRSINQGNVFRGF